MIKKEYLQPEVAVVHLVADQTILTGSIVHVIAADIAWNDSEDGFEDFFNK